MKRFAFACALAASALWLAAPANAAQPAPLPKPSASFSSGSLHVDVYGTPGKPALIFIPGLTCGPWEWAGEIARFSPSFSIYALTLPGFDGQPGINAPLFQTVSADFWKLLQARGIHKPILIGHSLGGTLAILLAEQHSQLLRGAIAVDGLPVFPGTESMNAGQRDAMAEQMASSVAAASTPAAFENAEKTYVLPYMMTSKADVAAVAPLVARSDPKASAQWMREDLLLDLRPQLGSVAVPLLELAPFDPRLDPNSPARFTAPGQKQAYYASLLAADRSAGVQIVAPSRHFIMYDDPGALDEAIAAFLKSTPE